MSDARTRMVRLCEQGVDWRRYASGAHVIQPGLRPAAVLVLFGQPKDANLQVDLETADPNLEVELDPLGLDLLFVERSASLNHHPGQIAFPGGRIDPQDHGPVPAALREANEETGLDAQGVEVLGTLTPLPLPISNHLVTPVLGWWQQRSQVAAVDPAESAHVFHATIAELLANRRTAVVRRGNTTMRSPGFLTQNHLIWGFTGIVLCGLLTELGWAKPELEHPEIEVPV